MKAQHTIKLTAAEAAETRKLLDEITEVPKDSLIWERWVEFPDSTYAVRLEIISPLDPREEPCWSQAGLFVYEQGQWVEIGYSEVSDTILGEWEYDEAILLVEEDEDE